MNQFLATLSAKKVCNLLKNRASFVWSLVSRSGCVAGAPVSLSVEPGAVCQLHCPECVLGAGQLRRTQRFIDFDLYRTIIDQNCATLCYLMLYFQGEPFLVPHIFDMIRYADQRGIFTATSTNAQNIDDTMAEKIVASGLKKLIVSLDGTTQQSYERYRRGGKMENVLGAIEKINAEKAKKSVATPAIELQFIVFRHNETEIDAFEQLAKRLKVQKTTIKSAQIYNFQQKEALIPTKKRFSRYTKEGENWRLKQTKHNFCLRQWQGAVVTTDGLLVPCCFDKNADFSFGQITSSNFMQIWHGERATQFRCQILRDCSKFEMCRNCSE